MKSKAPSWNQFPFPPGQAKPGGGSVLTVLENSASVQGALGPDLAITQGLVFHALPGSIVIAAFMSVTGTPGDAVGFVLTVGGTHVVAATQTADANGFASMSFPFLAPTAGGAVDIDIIATAAHNLTSTAIGNLVMATQLPSS
jgi:hypothetical protein